MLPSEVDVLVVGAGASGIGAAVRLRDAGRDFLVIEKGDSVGGTWRENTYPGVACDVLSSLYSYSFARNPDWSRLFAGGEEIRRYLHGVASERGVLEHVRFGIELLDARWEPDAGRWRVSTTGGELRAGAIIAAAGPLHEPSIPSVPGLKRFDGRVFHTAQWDHDHDLSGRDVAIVGTGASAIQVIPHIAPLARSLTVVQRTPAWVLPKPDHPVPRVERLAFRLVPGAQQLFREGLYHGLELLQRAQRRPAVMAQLQRIAQAHLRLAVRDPQLRAALTPSFTLGCKRILMSNSYYGALQRPNVTVVPHALQRVTPKAIITADGGRHPVDTIIFATGFEVADPPIAHRLRRADGCSLSEVWNGSPTAYRGTMVAGFPNAFVILGPNTGNGHTSAFVVIEAQLDLIMGALRQLDTGEGGAIAPRLEAQHAWDAEVQEALAGTVWNAGGCDSWYLGRDGRNSSIYPWGTGDLRRRCRALDLDDFEHVPLQAVTR